MRIKNRNQVIIPFQLETLCSKYLNRGYGRKLYLILVLLFTYSIAECCCGSFGVNTMPIGGEIPKNAIFIISFNNSDFKFKEDKTIEKLKFFVQGKFNQKTKLIVDEILYSGSIGQIVLKPIKNLKPDEVVQLLVKTKVRSLKDSTSFMSFSRQLKRRKWHVTNLLDTISPRFNNHDIKTIIIDNRMTTRGGFDLLFEASVEDNFLDTLEYDFYGQITNPIYYKFKIGSETFITYTSDLRGGIYTSMCERNFTFLTHTDYIAMLTAIDYSGNESEEIEFPFRITLPENEFFKTE